MGLAYVQFVRHRLEQRARVQHARARACMPKTAVAAADNLQHNQAA